MPERTRPAPTADNLRGLTGDTCPECNQPLVLRVGLDEPRLGSLIAAGSGLLAGAGAGFLCLALVVCLSIRWGLPLSNDYFAVFILPVLCIAMEGGVAVRLLSVKGRVWFRGLERGGRGVMIAAGWILTAVAAILFTITFNA